MSTTIHVGNALDVLARLPSESVHCCVTSPPYWGLRSYEGGAGMIGLEPTFEEHLENLVAVFREVRRVLRSDGTLWLNYGDAYAGGGRGGDFGNSPKQASNQGSTLGAFKPAGYKPKDLMLMPARVAMALQADGWWLRSEIVWHKPNPMPESCTDRPTSSHEKMFLLSNAALYFYDAEAVRVRDGNGWHGKERPTHAPEHAASQGQGPRNLRGQYAQPYDGEDGKDFADTGAQDARSVKARIVEGVRNGSITGANLRNVWTIATCSFKEAHFATFPPALVEPCILAGTSERGVCGECGAPWKRQTKTTLVPTKKAAKTFVIDDRDMAADANDAASNRQKDGHKSGWRNDVATTGWVPTCEHKAATVQAVCLDPFAGSGTVGLVADRLQRDSVLIELSPEYAEMAGRRIKADAPLLAKVEVV